MSNWNPDPPLSASSACKPCRRKAFHARLQAQQVPGQGLCGQCGCGKSRGGGGHIEVLQPRPAEDRTGGPLYRQANLCDDASGRRQAAHAPSVPEGDPDVVIRIDRHAIGNAFARAEACELPLGEGVPGLIELHCGNAPMGTIGHQHGAVGQKAWSIGYADAGANLLGGTTGVQPIQRAVGTQLGIVHGAGPEPPVVIDFAIIEAVASPLAG